MFVIFVISYAICLFEVSEETVKSENKCNAGQFARHLDDCNKYYECLWGVYRETRCPPGLFWNKVFILRFMNGF